MLFRDLLNDHTVAAVRLARWASPTDRLELPPVIDGERGPWCTLHAFDGVAHVTQPIMALAADDGSNGWLPWTEETALLECKARNIARDFAQRYPESYVTDPLTFQPHAWVVLAIAEALRRGC